MPQATWNGFLRLSLVSCPVYLSPATTNRKRLQLEQLSARTGNPLTQQYVDSKTGDVVGPDAMVNAYRQGGSGAVTISEQELASLEKEPSKLIDIDYFAPQEEVDRLYLDAVYYIYPDGQLASDTVHALRLAMVRNGRVALARVQLEGRERLVMIEPRGSGLMMATVRSSEDVEQPDFAERAETEIPVEMVEIAETIMKRRAGSFDTGSFRDPYQDALQSLIDDKVRQGSGGSGGSARPSQPEARPQPEPRPAAQQTQTQMSSPGQTSAAASSAFRSAVQQDRGESADATDRSARGNATGAGAGSSDTGAEAPSRGAAAGGATEAVAADEEEPAGEPPAALGSGGGAGAGGAGAGAASAATEYHLGPGGGEATGERAVYPETAQQLAAGAAASAPSVEPDGVEPNGVEPRGVEPRGVEPDQAETEPEGHELGTEILLHIVGLGDRRYVEPGWAGNPGSRRQIEALSIRPREGLAPSAVEFKVFAQEGRATSWVSDGNYAGTRGRGLPLTGFAVRPSQDLRERLEIVYEGCFFEGGVVGPKRDGELCISPVANDPLEAVRVSIMERAEAEAEPATA
ncbi:MAG: hypothetical protein JO038_01255 [Alphaproteobacteria bacterium]|nr:hypothetical protein [Alphaproteobacteria bacterium]